MHSSTVNIRASIFFEDPAECFETTSLDTTSCSAPTIFTGQKLRGAVRVSSDARYVFDVVQLIFKGDVTNIVRLADGGSWMIKKPLVLMSYVKVAEDFQRLNTGTSQTITHQVDFFFDIPESIPLPSHENETLQKLPPSIRVLKSTLQDARENYSSAAMSSCDVSYHIEARIFRCGRRVCEVNREILIMPVTEIPPPLEPEDFKGEFQLVATSSLKSHLNPKKSITVKVSSSEPPPLVFPTKEGEMGSTKLLLYFRTGVILSEWSERTVLESQIANCEVSVALDATTYFLANEQASAMSVAEAIQSPLVVIKNTRFEEEKRKLNLKGWKRVRERASGTTRLFELETELTMFTVLPRNFSRLPSFISTLVARRYAFDLEIILSLGRGVALHKPIKLRIPVQVVHCPAQKCRSRPSEVAIEEDLKAPPYVT